MIAIFISVKDNAKLHLTYEQSLNNVLIFFPFCKYFHHEVHRKEPSKTIILQSTVFKKQQLYEQRKCICLYRHMHLILMGCRASYAANILATTIWLLPFVLW